MKVTGPSKEKTKRLIALLEKTGRKSKSAIWLDLATRLQKPRRQRPSINLWKIQKLAKVFKGKNLVVPGKVLGFGEVSEKISVVGFEFSGRAREKIEKVGGKAISLEKAIEEKLEPKTMVIVK